MHNLHQQSHTILQHNRQQHIRILATCFKVTSHPVCPKNLIGTLHEFYIHPFWIKIIWICGTVCNLLFVNLASRTRHAWVLAENLSFQTVMNTIRCHTGILQYRHHTTIYKCDDLLPICLLTWVYIVLIRSETEWRHSVTSGHEALVLTQIILIPKGYEE